MFIIIFYSPSVPAPFKGDYLNLVSDMKWKKIHPLVKDVNIVFTDLVQKVNRANGKVRFTPLSRTSTSCLQTSCRKSTEPTGRYTTLLKLFSSIVELC